MKRLWLWLFPPPVDLMQAQLAEIARRPVASAPPAEGGFGWIKIDTTAITADRIAANTITVDRITIP